MPNYQKGYSPNDVKSVIKAFLIMEELDKSGELSIGELSERLDMDKATVHRLVNTIKNAGYVNQNIDSKKYSNSLRLLAMGNRVIDKTGIKHVSRPFLSGLAERTGETVNVGVWVENKIIYVDKRQSNSTIKVDLSIGTDVPSYCTGLGKAMLAFMPENELQQVLGSVSFEKYTDRTITDTALFMKELAIIRERGCAIDDEEYVEGLICIAAPIFDYHAKPIAAISVSSPKYRFDVDRHLEFYSELVMEAAFSISKKLGFNPA